jgi:hypothetical protein
VNRRRSAAVLAAASVWSTLAATPAFAALHRDAGDDPGKQISTLKAILVFGVIPIGLTALISLLVLLPSLAKGPRYRLGEEWRAIPEWYGAPGAEAEVSSGGYGSHRHAPVEAAAEQQAVTGTVVPSDAEVETGDGGGSSARW